MFAVAAETYPELGGPISKQAGTLNEWQVYELSDPHVALDLAAVAVAGEEVVGFGTLLDIGDGKVGVHRITVVLPALAWARRGLRSDAEPDRGGEASLLRAARGVGVDRSAEAALPGLGYERRGASIDFFGPLLQSS